MNAVVALSDPAVVVIETWIVPEGTVNTFPYASAAVASMNRVPPAVVAVAAWVCAWSKYALTLNDANGPSAVVIVPVSASGLVVVGLSE